KVLQGNLDPAILLADWETIEARTKAILDDGMKDGRHVFNLGHGVTPDITQETLQKLDELIRSYSKRKKKKKIEEKKKKRKKKNKHKKIKKKNEKKNKIKKKKIKKLNK